MSDLETVMREVDDALARQIKELEQQRARLAPLLTKGSTRSLDRAAAPPKASDQGLDERLSKASREAAQLAAEAILPAVHDLLARENGQVVAALQERIPNILFERMAVRIDELGAALETRLPSSLSDRVSLIVEQMSAALQERIPNDVFNRLSERATRTSEEAAQASFDRIVPKIEELQELNLPVLLAQSNESTAAQIIVRASLAPMRQGAERERGNWRAAKPQSFDALLKQAERDFPSAYPHWIPRMRLMEKQFLESKVGNAANEQDIFSHAFRSFVKFYAVGRILDIGPGIYGVPFYLLDVDSARISAVEPLEASAKDFELVRGFGEYLPWPGGSFETVVSGTSLDHAISLERSLAEAHRVTAPGGQFLLWIDEVVGSPAFNPDSPDYVPSDQNHLFHFDRVWFEPQLQALFETTERIVFRLPTYNKIFYRLLKRG